jgi:hypothetical protein
MKNQKRYTEEREIAKAKATHFGSITGWRNGK